MFGQSKLRHGFRNLLKEKLARKEQFQEGRPMAIDGCLPILGAGIFIKKQTKALMLLVVA